MSGRTLKAAALISGGGRTAISLERAMARDDGPARIELVIAHKSDLEGARRCREAGMQVKVVPGPAGDPTSDLVDEMLVDHGIELVCLCGYLRRFRVANGWRGRVINIHPALLPEFGGAGMYGSHVHKAVLEAGSPISGCTVHWVDEEYDSGTHILQRTCPVFPGDSVESQRSH